MQSISKEGGFGNDCISNVSRKVYIRVASAFDVGMNFVVKITQSSGRCFNFFFPVDAFFNSFLCQGWTCPSVKEESWRVHWHSRGGKKGNGQTGDRKARPETLELQHPKRYRPREFQGQHGGLFHSWVSLVMVTGLCNSTSLTKFFALNKDQFTSESRHVSPRRYIDSSNSRERNRVFPTGWTPTLPREPQRSRSAEDLLAAISCVEDSTVPQIRHF